MGPVEYGDVPQPHPLALELLYLVHYRLGLRLRAGREVAHDRLPGWQRWDELLLHTVLVVGNQGVGRRQYLRGGAVIAHHHDGAGSGVLPVEIQQVFHIGAPPGVDGLVRVAHDEQVLVIAAQHLHQLILQRVNVLELVNHDVFQALLPFQADIRVFLEDVQGKLDEVVVVQAEALFLLVEIAVEDDVVGGGGVVILLLQGLQGHGNHVPVIIRLLEQFLDFYHIPGSGEGHVPEGQPVLLVDDLEHRVDIAVVQHQEAAGILESVAVLLQNRHAEAVEGVDVPSVVVPGELVDALAHLVGRFVGKGHAQDVSRQNPQLVHQEGEAMGEGPGLAGARPGDNTHPSLGGGDGLPLRFIQFVQ